MQDSHGAVRLGNKPEFNARHSIMSEATSLSGGDLESHRPLLASSELSILRSCLRCSTCVVRPNVDQNGFHMFCRGDSVCFLKKQKRKKKKNPLPVVHAEPEVICSIEFTSRTQHHCCRPRVPVRNTGFTLNVKAGEVLSSDICQSNTGQPPFQDALFPE